MSTHSQKGSLIILSKHMTFNVGKTPIPSAHRHTYICTHALTHFLILSFTLVFYTPSLAAGDIAREARTLVNSLS